MMEFMGIPVYGIPEVVLGITAFAVSLALFLYPTPSLFRLHMGRESSRRVQPYPFCFTNVACAVWLYYAMLIADGSASKFRISCLVVVNGWGFIFQLVYLCIFKPHCTDRQLNTLKIFLCAELLLIWFPSWLNGLFHALSGPENEIVYGSAGIVFGIMMYASTIPSIVDAYITHSTNYLPLGLCTMHFLNAIAWFAYALYTFPKYDVYLAVANGAGIILGIVQLLMCCILIVKFRESGSTVNPDIDPKTTPLLDSIV